jgi:hypothetical protein
MPSGLAMKCQIFVHDIGIVNVNKTSDGLAHDADGNTYQFLRKWTKICCPKKETVMLQSKGDAPMTNRHSVSIRR